MPKVPDEFLKAQYELKCSYVARQLEQNGFVGLFDEMIERVKIVEKSLNWGKRSDFGIDEDAFEKLKTSGSSLPLYLCHPNVLCSIPGALKYYRCISVFSQKGLKSVSKVSSVDKLEVGKPSSVTREMALRIARAVNGNVCTLYKTSIPEGESLRALMYATAGITFDGSWKNAIGFEGERVIKSVILRHALINSELQSVTVGDKIYAASKLTEDWVDKFAGKLSSVLFTNGAVAQFGSEPDVTLLDSGAAVVGGIEVKAGLDPAGALERLGAMLKSFDSINETAPSAEKILVVACVTDEVAARLNRTKSVTRHYSLTDIMLNRKKDEARFANMVRGVLGLVTEKK